MTQANTNFVLGQTAGKIPMRDLPLFIKSQREAVESRQRRAEERHAAGKEGDDASEDDDEDRQALELQFELAYREVAKKDKDRELKSMVAARGEEELTQEERDELKKIRMVVGAAGAMFSKDLRDLRAEVKARTKELIELEHLEPAERRSRLRALQRELHPDKQPPELRALAQPLFHLVQREWEVDEACRSASATARSAGPGGVHIGQPNVGARGASRGRHPGGRVERD